jgi:hypothetical protein
MVAPERMHWAWTVGALWLLVWNALVVWRFWRYMKEAAIKGDRHYDRVGKYDLPPEYADSESATKARWRRKR